MKDQKPCPICGTPAIHETDRQENILLEETLECLHCGYSYTYAYGFHSVAIGAELFEWGWSDCPENRRAEEDCQKATERERRRYSHD